MYLIKPYSYLNSKFDKGDIRIIHMPSENQKDLPFAIVSAANLSATLPPEETQVIADAWMNELKKEALQNEGIVSVRFIEAKKGILRVAPADYRTWKTTAKKGFYDRFGCMYIPNSLNVQLLAQTEDNQIVLGTRPSKENGQLPAFQVPGGMVKMSDAWDGSISPDRSAVREFREEVGDLPVRDVSYLGASFYAGRVITTLYYAAYLVMDSRELTAWRRRNRNNIQDYQAFPQEYYVPATAQGIHNARQSGRLRETAEVGLLLKGRELLGNDWFRKNQPIRMRG